MGCSSSKVLNEEVVKQPEERQVNTSPKRIEVTPKPAQTSSEVIENKNNDNINNQTMQTGNDAGIEIQSNENNIINHDNGNYWFHSYYSSELRSR